MRAGSRRNDIRLLITQAPLTETVLLVTIAIRMPEQKLQWNTETLSFDNQPAAQTMAQQALRKGWTPQLDRITLRRHQKETDR